MPKTETAVKTARPVEESQVAVSDVPNLREEALSLEKKNAEVKGEIQFALTTAQAELNRLRNLASIEEAKAKTAIAKLDCERQEFQSILTAFKKEKDLFEAERQKVRDLAETTQKMKDKLSRFIVMIRRESQEI